MPRKKSKNRPSFLRSLFKKLFIFGLTASIWLGLFAFLVVFYYSKDLPNIDDLGKVKSQQIIQVNYSNQKPITRFGENFSTKVSFEELPTNLVNAVIAIEDRRFFKHFGVDVFGIARAFHANYKAGVIVQGGSTITQQLAKMLFLKPERTIKRKIQEILLALQLEKSFSKKEILSLYLNKAYFGSGNYGIANAAKSYFGKDVSQLNLNESAMLAGLLKAPSKLSPKNSLQQARQRSHIVLGAMIDSDLINSGHVSELDIDPEFKIDRMQRMYFANAIKNNFDEFLSKSDLNLAKINIETTLDEEVQDALENSLNQFITKHHEKLGSSQLAVIVMEKDGAITGMIGGRDYQHSQFNRALYSTRQAGSAFKTLIYLSAFEHDYEINHTFNDQEISIGKWMPKNYDGKYYGEVTLKTAFAKSLNSVSAQLAKNIGYNKITSTAIRAGITSKVDINDLTISLGSNEVNLVELTNSYATIANNGNTNIPYMIKSITDANGQNLYQRTSSGFGQIFNDESITKIKTLLRYAVTNGTASKANIANNIYGKTGTSQDYRDAWFIGFDNHNIIGIWIGNDDYSPTNQISGGSLPAELFQKIITNLRS